MTGGLEDWSIGGENLDKYFIRKKYLFLKLLEDWRIQEKNSPFKMAGGLEDWRIQEFLGEKITLFKMTGGLEDSR